MGYIYKVNTYGYKVDWWDWQSGSRNRWCKAYEGFYYIVGKKKNRYGARSTLFFDGGHLGLAVFCRVSHLLKMVWPPIDVYFWSASHFGDGMFSHWHLLHICSFSSQLYSKTLHKLYTICFWNHSVSPISLLYIHIYLLYKCTPCVYLFMKK
jgi:hypothetical protein